MVIDFDRRNNGGGGGGSSNYNELSNKPKINSLELSGNMSASDLRLASSADVAGKYTKPQTGIPKTDLESAVQTSLGKADTAYQKASSGIPKADLTSVVQTSLEKADSAYQKPSSGIPSTELASDVQTTLEKVTELEQNIGDLEDLETPTKTDLVGAINEAYNHGGGGGMVICDIDDVLAPVLMRWPLLKDAVLDLVENYPDLQDGLLAHPDLAPQYVASKDTIDDNEGLDESVGTYPTLVIAISETPAIAPVIVSNEGLDAIVAANPLIAPALIQYPALVAHILAYPAVAKSLVKWPALAPVLLAETRYIPYLAEDEIIAHSLVETGLKPWLVGDGTAYINTGLYQLEWPLKVKANVAYNATSEMYLGGNYTGSSNGSRVGIASSKHTMYSGSNYQPISTAIVTKQEYAVEFEYAGLTGKKMTVNGAANENTTHANKVGANNLPFGWFSCKGNALTNGLNGRISDAYLTIGENEYRYIPAMYDGKYGFLEVTTMTFKGNNNTNGAFYVMTTAKENG